MAIVLLAGASTAGARDKMTGVNGIRFGWKYDKCVEALGDPQRSVTTDPINEQRQYSYAPASWGTVAWDNGVLDFYKDKLMQVGFSRTTATPDMSLSRGHAATLPTSTANLLRYATPTTTFCGVPPTAISPSCSMWR